MSLVVHKHILQGEQTVGGVDVSFDYPLGNVQTNHRGVLPYWTMHKPCHVVNVSSQDAFYWNQRR